MPEIMRFGRGQIYLDDNPEPLGEVTSATIRVLHGAEEEPRDQILRAAAEAWAVANAHGLLR